jgi:hypothetical protein
LFSGISLLWVYNIKFYPLLFVGTPKQPTGSNIAVSAHGGKIPTPSATPVDSHPTAEQIDTSLSDCSGISESGFPTPEIPPPTPETTLSDQMTAAAPIELPGSRAIHSVTYKQNKTAHGI